jgi:hypothetical protein
MQPAGAASDVVIVSRHYRRAVNLQREHRDWGKN